MKRLYCVTVETVAYAVAENVDEARWVIEHGLDTAVGTWDINASEVSPKHILEHSWADSIPFGSDDDRTVTEILAASAKGD